MLILVVYFLLLHPTHAKYGVNEIMQLTYMQVIQVSLVLGHLENILHYGTSEALIFSAAISSM